MLLKPAKTALKPWLHGNDSVLRATIFGTRRHTLQIEPMPDNFGRVV